MNVLVKSEWISRDEYRNLLNEFDDLTTSIYHRLSWIDAISNGFGINFGFVSSYDMNGNILALTPFMIKRKGPLYLIGTPLRGMFTEFAGPLLKKELSNDTLIEIMHSIHLLIAKKSIYLEWGAQGKQAWGNILDIFGYSSIRRPTLLIDLNNNESEIWASFTSRARNMIRKAEKSGVLTQRIYPDESWIAKYYEMLQANFLRQNIKVPHPYSFYQQIKALSRDEIAMCFNAEVNGEMVAAGIFLVDTNRLLYFSGVTSELGMKLAASSLVQWHAIKEAIQMDISKYDMGGLGVESIDRFKRSFGGYDYFHYRYIHQSKFLKLLEPLIYWALRKGYLKFAGV